jgi:leucyl aminopeptidase
MPATTMPSPACHLGPLSAVDADLLVLPWFEGESASAEAALDAATGGEIARALSSKEFQAKRYDMFLTAVTDRTWPAQRVALIGGGPPADGGTEMIRKLASAAGLIAKQKRIGRVAFAIRSKGDVAELAQAAAEGLTLAEFSGGSYKTTDPPPDGVPEWIIAASGSATDSAVADAVAKGRVLGQCSNLARALANEPGNTLTPSEFARRAAALAGDVGVRVDILDEKTIADLGMGLLLGVAPGGS